MYGPKSIKAPCHRRKLSVPMRMSCLGRQSASFHWRSETWVWRNDNCSLRSAGRIRFIAKR